MLNFPENPDINEEYTYSSITWIWDGISWNKVLENIGNGATGPTGATGPAGPTGATGPAGNIDFLLLNLVN